jgi:tetratricopeptide (TPR) repeat protein
MFNPFRPKYLIVVLFILLSPVAYANINAIDFSKVHFPEKLQNNIDFLKQNDRLYDHWSQQWNYQISKDTVVARLSFLYDQLSAIPDKNEETDLLLGDIAHYLYNLDQESYYQKAVDNYKNAIAIASNDYRTYWFLANHYSLSAQASTGINTYSTAFKYLPQKPNPHFWADYSVACATAGMISTAYYATHQLSIAEGSRSHMEDDMANIIAHTIRVPPIDTTIVAKDLWSSSGKQDGKIKFVNWVDGTKFMADSLWGMELGDYNNQLSYAVLKPLSIIAKDGQKIDYSILVLAKVAGEGESLEQFLNKFTQKQNNKKPYTFDFCKNTGNCIGIEATNPEVYTNIGGSHTFAIAFERYPPEFPGMKLEEVTQIPVKPGMQYYSMPRKYGHLNKKIYYLVLLDTCEYIKDKSLDTFNDFLSGLVVE